MSSNYIANDDVILTSARTPDYSHADVSLASIITSTSDPDLLEKKSMEYLMSLTPTLVFFACLTAVGLVGNCLVCLVYYKGLKPSATRTYILAISGCDLVSNVWYLPTDVIFFRFQYTYYSEWACKLSWTVVGFLAVLTGLLLVAVAIDRQMRVCQNQSVANRYAKKARKAVLGCVVFSCLLTLPMTYTVEGRAETLEDGNVTGMKCVLMLPQEKTFNFAYNFVLMMVTAAAVTTMLVCYGRIAQRLWQHNKRHVSSGRREQGMAEESAETPFSSTAAPTTGEAQAKAVTVKGHSKVSTAGGGSEKSSTHDHSATQSSSPPRPGVKGKKIPTKTTLMLFVLTVVFILSYVPHLIVRILGVVGKISQVLGEDTLGENLRHIMYRSYWLNSVINPFVYSLCSARFRSECRRLFKNNRRVSV